MPKGPRRSDRRSGSPVIAPLLALIGLLVLTGGSVFAASFVEGLMPAAAVDPSPTPVQVAAGTLAPGATPAEPTDAPKVILTPPPELTATVTGSILFTKGGGLWGATGEELRQLSRKGTDSSPTWGSGGRRVFVVETKERVAESPVGGDSKYTFYVNNIVSMAADGTDRKMVFESLFAAPGGGQWYTTALQPDISPNGRTIALVSDLGIVPSGLTDVVPVVLSTMGTNGTPRLRSLDVQTADEMGHNDPDWSPDGRRIAFTYDARSGVVGAPRIGILTVANRRLALLRRGFANPSWSPDGRYIVCERTTGTGRDVVVIDPANGAEVGRLTNDGNSFAPVWSPNGDQIAYLQRTGLKIDLRIITLDLSTSLTRIDDKAVTEGDNLDAGSNPAWFIPEDQTVTPSPGAALASTAP